MGTATHASADDLEASFDQETARALRAWAGSMNRRVSVPSRPWSGAGHSGAQLAAVMLGPADTSAPGRVQKLIVKVCPAGLSAEETRRHQAAWDSSAEFAKRHLVRQPYPPYPMGDGRSLMFQEIAGSLQEVTPLSLLPSSHRPAVLRETARLVLAEWNTRGPLQYTTSATDYLRMELRDGLAATGPAHHWTGAVGPLDQDCEWIRTREDQHLGVLPNPLSLAGPDSVISAVNVDYLAGNTHGDLHLANVLVPAPPRRGPRLAKIRLVDLSAYSENAPLTRDLVTLMLSALLSVVDKLPPDQAEALLDYVVTPQESFPTLFPQLYAEVVWSIYKPGVDFAGSLGDEWRAQYLLSLAAHALIHSSYDNAGASGRWWYFRLAARAGAAFLASLPASPAPGYPRLVKPPDELAVEPSPHPQAGRHHIGGAPRSTGPLVMMPPYSGPMIERPRLIEQVIGLLREPARNLVELGAVLEGTGGFGKTVLAQQICDREEILQLFPDGILWVDIGEHAHGAELASKINDLSEIVSGHRPTLSVPEVAGDQFGRLIGDRSMLLVLDDVWTSAQLRAFLHGAPRSMRLVTTRSRTVAPQEARAVAVGAMEHKEALHLLTAEVPALPPRYLEDLLRMTGRWPLLLALVNRAIRRAVRDGASEADAAREVIARLRRGGPTALDLASATDRSVAVQATMEVGLNQLDQDHIDRCLELSIFSEDTEIPLRVLEPYWHATGQLSPADVVHTCEALADLSFLSFHQGTSAAVRLHDVIRAYLRRRCGSERLETLNRAFLDAMKASTQRGATEPDGQTSWWSLPAEFDYVWRFLAYHLAEAQLHGELTKVVSDLRFVAAKLQLLGPVAVEADLVLGSGPVARELLWGLQRSSHLLASTDPARSVVDVFLSRLGDVDELRPAVEAYRRIVTGHQLQAAWPPPDSPHSALRRIIYGHTAPLGGCALSRDGARLITSGDDSARVWDMATGRLLSVLEGHAGPVLSCAISPDGTWAVTTGDDHDVRLWDLATGTERAVLSGHTAVVRRCAISPDGTWLASVGDDHLVRIWDVRAGTERAQLAGHTGAVRACAISRDGRWLVTGGGDGTVRIWDAAQGSLQAVLEGHAGAVRSCAVSADGRWVVSAGGDGTLRRSDARTGNLDAVLSGHRGSVRACAISPDDTLIVSGGADGTIRLWGAASGEQLTVLPGHDAAVRGCALSEDGAWLVSVGEDRTIRTWDLRRALASPTTGHPTRAVVRTCAAFPTGARLATGGTDAKVRIWDVENGKLLQVFRGHQSTVRCCAVSQDGGSLATGGDDKTVKIWDAVNGSLLTTLSGHCAAVRCCAFGPDGSWLVSGASDGLVRVWDLATQSVQREFGHPGVAIWACAVPPTGDWLASVGDDSVLRVWEIESGILRAELAGHQGTTWACAAGPDGQWVISAGNDHTVRLWDVTACQERGVLHGHQAWLNACCVSPDGRWAASAGYDPTIRVWDIEKMKLMTELEGHSGVIWALAAGGQGSWLASAAGDETVRIWNPHAAISRAVLDVNATAVRGCAATPDGGWALCVGGAGTAYRVNLSSGEKTDLPLNDSVSYNDCAVSPDGLTAAIAGEDGGIRLWNATTNTMLELELHHPGAALSCVFGSDASSLATSAGDGTIIIWDLARRRSRAVLDGHRGWVRTCAIAPNGSWLVSGGDDGTTRVWETASGRQRLHLTPDKHSGRVRACSIAPDGSWLASSGDDGAVSIWSPADGALIAELADDSGAVLACPVSHDGRFLAAITDNRTISVWDVARKARVAFMRVEQPLRGGIWVPGSHGLCLIGESGVYRYDAIVNDP